MRPSALTSVRCCLSPSALCLCIRSPTIHKMPRPSKMPRKGGKCVTALNTGTSTSTPRPRTSMVRRSAGVVGKLPSLAARAGETTGRAPRRQDTTASGTSRFTMDARNTPCMMASVVTCPPIHSMVVVTSPIGVHAPPALAAMTMMPAIKCRSSRPSSRRFMSETMTMAVVRLSRIELRKKVARPTSQTSDDSRWVLIRVVSTSKPSCASTTSTIAMAPIRKNTICAVPVSDSASSVFSTSAVGPSSAYSVHSKPAPIKAVADLLI